jgi:hypothetical protein
MRTALAKFNLLILLQAALLASVVVSRETGEPQRIGQCLTWSRDLLRTIYPTLNSNDYVITAETYLAFDHLESRATIVKMDVGEGPSDFQLATAMGCRGSVVQPDIAQPDLPENLKPIPGDRPAANASSLPSSSAPVCGGSVYPKQVLHAIFRFDKTGEFLDFTAQGTSLTDDDADAKLAEIFKANPQMTPREINNALESSGLKYPKAREREFKAQIPVAALEQILGKLRVISTNFRDLQDSHGIFGYWEVSVETTGQEGLRKTYLIAFDHRTGDITAISRAQVGVHSDPGKYGPKQAGD